MQLSLDLIDGISSVSHEIAFALSEAKLGAYVSNSFVSGPILLRPPYKVTEDELILMYGDAVVAFKDVVPSKILSIEVDPPVTLREDVKSVELESYNNDGSTQIEREYTHTEEHTVTETVNIAAEISTAIRAKIGGSYAGFSAELETQISAKLGVTHNTQEQYKTTNVEKIDVVIPAWTNVALLQKESISDIKQTVCVSCEMDAAVRINGGWEKRFDSIHQLLLYLQGGGGGTGDAPQLDEFCSTRAFQNMTLPFENLQFRVSKGRLYKDVKTGELNRSETEIPH